MGMQARPRRGKKQREDPEGEPVSGSPRHLNESSHVEFLPQFRSSSLKI